MEGALRGGGGGDPSTTLPMLNATGAQQQRPATHPGGPRDHSPNAVTAHAPDFVCDEPMPMPGVAAPLLRPMRTELRQSASVVAIQMWFQSYYTSGGRGGQFYNAFAGVFAMWYTAGFKKRWSAMPLRSLGSTVVRRLPRSIGARSSCAALLAGLRR